MTTLPEWSCNVHENVKADTDSKAKTAISTNTPDFVVNGLQHAKTTFKSEA